MSDSLTLLMDPKDNVAMVLQETPADTTVDVIKKGKKVNTVRVLQNVPVYHKIALQDLKKGAQIVKYGELVGVASCDINKGEHVHVHNIGSVKV